MLIYLIIIALGILIVLFFIKTWLNKIEEKNSLLIEWLKSSNSNINQQLSSSMTQFNMRLDKAAQIIAQVQKNIGEFTEISRSIHEWQQFLSSPKTRGLIGEQILSDLLNQHFPKSSFKLQYQFRSGEKVDAAIFTAQGIIPIDAKFPLDNFKNYLKAEDQKIRGDFKKAFLNDVKKHIEKISQKYILPEEKTVDYALMYIPSENVYYEIISSEDVFNFAGEKRVLPVSPMSFFAYIKAILLSFEGQKIEKKAKQIITLLQAIKKDYEKTQETIGLVNKHLTNAYSQMNNLNQQFQSLGEKISSSKLLE